MLSLVGFEFRIRGRRANANDVGDLLRSQAITAITQQLNARFDGKTCKVHGGLPSAIVNDDLSSATLSFCCQEFANECRGEDASEDTEHAEEIPSPVLQIRPDARPPRVFLSHATADKQRFVNKFDELLRARGLEVWLDDRDLLPGMNLVDAIFRDGISKSDVVIVALSNNTIDRSWVIEELSVAVVQKIDGIVKMLIPVVLDDVEPPPSLKSTVWEKIPDLERLERHADRIAASVFGAAPAPVAPAPRYAGIPVHKIAGLQPNDERLFVMACEQLLEYETAYPIVDLARIAAAASELGMAEAAIYESFEILEQNGFFSEINHYLGEHHPQSARIASYAFERYLDTYRPAQYRNEKLSIVSEIVNRDGSSSLQMAQALKINLYIVEHVLNQLESKGSIIASHSNQGIHLIAKPSLRRTLEALESDANNA